MPLSPEQVEKHRNRRLKEPIMISGYRITMSRLAVDGSGQPSTKQEMVVRKVETIRDIAQIEAHMRVGKFIPVPDLGIQALNLVLEKLDMLEDVEPDPEKVIQLAANHMKKEEDADGA